MILGSHEMIASSRVRFGLPVWLAVSILVLAVVCGAPARVCLASGPFEKPPVLQASQILPPKLASGPGYIVDQKVVNNGFFNTYQVLSPHGKFQAACGLSLEKLIREIKAIEVMAQLETTSAFRNSVQAGIRKTGRGLEALATDPIGTVAATVEQTAERVVGLFSWASRKLSPDKQESDPASQAEDHKLEKLAGLTDAKRRVAARFGVDVYSANEVLQYHLERIGWAEIAGGMSLGKALGQLPGPAQTALTASSGRARLEKEIAETPAGKLRDKTRKALEAMKLKPRSIDRFMANTYYSPREQAQYAAALHVMSTARDRHHFLEAGAGAGSRETAFRLTHMALMYAGYHHRVAKLTRIFPVGQVACARNAAGAAVVAVVAVPADHVIWSRAMAKSVKLLETQMAKWKKPAGVEFWLTGTLSPACAKQLKNRGWKIVPKAGKRLLAAK